MQIKGAGRGRARRSAIFIVLFYLGAIPAWADWNATAKGFASLVVPGSGQLLNDDPAAAAAHFGVFGVSVYAALANADKPDLLGDDERYDEDNDREIINKTTLRFGYAARAVTDTALYSSYAAYRDARTRDNAGYRTPLPTESLTDLARAPFSLGYLSRPTTFIPLAIQAAAVLSSKNGYRIDRLSDVSAGDLYVYNFVANEMTAVGEEAFFRGFVNNEASNLYGDRNGLIVSSVIFGLAHTGQGQTANALQAAAAGAYLGWLHQRNGFGAGEGAALHYWINVLAGISAIRNGERGELLQLTIPF